MWRLLVNTCCRNKCHRLGGLNNNRWFSPSSGGWKSKCKHGRFLVRTLPGLYTSAFLWCPHMGERERDRQMECCLVSLPIRALIPFWRPHPRDLIYPYYLQRPHLQIPLCWRLGLQHMDFGWAHFNPHQQLLSQSYFICIKAIKCIFRINKYDIKHPRYILILRWNYEFPSIFCVYSVSDKWKTSSQVHGFCP